MAVLKNDVDLRRRKVGEILTRELFECGDHSRAIALAHCLAVGAVFRTATAGVGNKRHKGLNYSEARAHK